MSAPSNVVNEKVSAEPRRRRQGLLGHLAFWSPLYFVMVGLVVAADYFFDPSLRIWVLAGASVLSTVMFCIGFPIPAHSGYENEKEWPETSWREQPRWLFNELARERREVAGWVCVCSSGLYVPCLFPEAGPGTFLGYGVLVLVATIGLAVAYLHDVTGRSRRRHAARPMSQTGLQRTSVSLR